ncbi:MAG: fumarylacetoacetate hydrolase family protein [Clostridiales bacterium]|nr:fumarylacetoacetate hydrolase family protein [Clostridiales bacterium]
MKFITYMDKTNNNEMLGILEETGVFPLVDANIHYSDMTELIEKINPEDLKKISLLSREKDLDLISFDNIKLLAPIPRPKQDIICLGINYYAHAVEAARYKEESFGGERKLPIYFSKRVTQAVAPDDYIDGHFDIVDSLDYESELAVIIKKDAKNVPKEKAFEYIFGYTIINDVSARNLQTQHEQWYLGKSLDTFTPMGPCITTVDEFQNPPKLKIMSKVNGELRQNSTTDLLIFDIPYIINDLTKGMTLKTGTIIATGTPAGVGMGFIPPKFLKRGDIVECEIEKIGVLKNTIK